MKPVSKSFAFRRSITCELAMALGLAVVWLAPAVAFADLPPYAGSSDDASYGDVQHATFGGDAASAPSAEVIARIAGSYDDVSYGDLRHTTFTAELQTPEEVLALGSGHDDVTYPTASPAPEQQAVASTERMAGRVAAIDGSILVQPR